ncbi:hypothetical protein DSM106972_094770 [Dulcicalothrix desertica PCC 7102]|uniref:Bacteriocin n=1 Tax=Dulcicalothrix desertica PCC 7102 TaxID=232991 RepID=A0A3S1I9D6_9CYAN|nr:hypothetical protein [Dulcicalothrix desertica]RUS94006.1 hypothetical protein DSM106972_094770 [Dulcicalothrix desertica PCC 7102]TWH62687.1 hypothetical protein CAL7102_00194 [Dulcicalothrix desertica PCC 7102]
MSSLIKNINAFELSVDELDAVAGGFASNTNLQKSILDTFKGQNLPFSQPSFFNFDSFQNNSNVVISDTGCEIIYPITVK